MRLIDLFTSKGPILFFCSEICTLFILSYSVTRRWQINQWKRETRTETPIAMYKLQQLVFKFNLFKRLIFFCLRLSRSKSRLLKYSAPTRRENSTLNWVFEHNYFKIRSFSKSFVLTAVQFKSHKRFTWSQASSVARQSVHATCTSDNVP